MREVLVGMPSNCVNLDNVLENTPIFAFKHGMIRGMIVHQGGWKLMSPNGIAETGLNESRKRCIERGMALGYGFFIEE